MSSVSLLVRLFCLTALEKGFGCLGGSFQWVQTSIHICWPKPNRNVFSILRFNLSSSIPCVKKVCSENVLWVLGATWAKDYSGNLGRKHLSPGNVVLGLQWVWSGVRAKSGQLFGLRSNNPVCRHFEVWWTKTYALPCPIQPFCSIFTQSHIPILIIYGATSVSDVLVPLLLGGSNMMIYSCLLCQYPKSDYIIWSVISSCL